MECKACSFDEDAEPRDPWSRDKFKRIEGVFSQYDLSGSVVKTEVEFQTPIEARWGSNHKYVDLYACPKCGTVRMAL